MRYQSKSGSINETMIRQALNNHLFKDLDPNWKRHMKRMFKDINDYDLIHADYYEYSDAKPDLVISVNKRRVFLSIKSGHAPCVHYEGVFSFYDFLKMQDVPKDIIRLIRFYHYGYDVRLTGQEKIMSREQIIEKYPGLIKKVNNYFIEHSEIVREIIYRSIISGRLKRDLIDYFYYGSVSKGYLLSIYDIVDLILKDKNSSCMSICFYGLTYVSGARDPNSPKNHNLKIHWPILCKYFYDSAFMKKYG